MKYIIASVIILGLGAPTAPHDVDIKLRQSLGSLSFSLFSIVDPAFLLDRNNSESEILTIHRRWTLPVPTLYW